MPEVLIIQHAGCEPIGTIGQVFDQNSISQHTVRTDLGDTIPTTISSFDGIVIMGGSMGVYEQDIYPFLTDEINLIKSAVAANIPVLGICLGGQLVSAALGGKVYKGEKKEIGWHPIYITPAATDDPLFSKLETFKTAFSPNFVGFSWHGDYFTLPTDAVLLAYSDMCECHAIRYGTNVYALQFHPEISPETVKTWLEEFAEDFASSGLDSKDLLEDTTRFADAQRQAALEIGRRWLALVVQNVDR